MKVEEFIKQIDTIIKYKGDYKKFILDNYEKLEIPFSLNDSFTGMVTDSGANSYRKAGERKSVQFWELMDLKPIVGAGVLPFLDCVFNGKE